MNKRKAKRLACQWVVREIDRVIDRDECDNPQEEQVKQAILALRDELALDAAQLAWKARRKIG